MAADDVHDTLRCMCCALCCCYEACDFNNPICLCKAAFDCLCIRHSACLAINTKPKGCGCTGNPDRGECCKIGLFCCDLGLVAPKTICACAEQCLCFYSVASFPCSKEYVPNPVFTLFIGLQVCPVCGCCVAPPPCRALDKILDEPSPPMSQSIVRK